MDAKLAKQIEQQKQKLEEGKTQLANLQAKARDVELKRFQRLAQKVGFYDVEISDADFEKALKSLADAARSQQKETAPA